jgi:hypothetical protein
LATPARQLQRAARERALLTLDLLMNQPAVPGKYRAWLRRALRGSATVGRRRERRLRIQALAPACA